MSKDESFENILLFVIGNNVDDGYAEVQLVFKRSLPGSWKQAWEDMEQGRIEQCWKPAPSLHRAGGIDMAFDTTQPCLAFVAISGDHHHDTETKSDGSAGLLHEATTYFGKKIVRDLDIRGGPTTPIIKSAKRHKLPLSDYPTVCSFEVDSASVLRELGSSAGASKITRFPIVFDFVDSDDGRSPVFKKPRKKSQNRPAMSIQAMLGHGGIHPRSGSSIIELF
jgi:hypothetical protein